jgi:hypothetical protein
MDRFLAKRSNRLLPIAMTEIPRDPSLPHNADASTCRERSAIEKVKPSAATSASGSSSSDLIPDWLQTAAAYPQRSRQARVGQR